MDNVYYLAAFGEAKKAADEFRRLAKQGLLDYRDFKERHGIKASGFIQGFSDHPSSICLDEEPDAALWRRLRDGSYVPNRNTTEGRKIHDEMCNLTLPGHGWLNEKFFGSRLLRSGTLCGIQMLDDKLIIIASDDDEPVFDAQNGLKRLKRSEYWKMAEETRHG